LQKFSAVDTELAVLVQQGMRQRNTMDDLVVFPTSGTMDGQWFFAFNHRAMLSSPHAEDVCTGKQAIGSM